jgi:hypothetical protein
MGSGNRRAGDDIVLPVYLTDGRSLVESPDGEMVGVGFKPYRDRARSVEVFEDEHAPVLPGVFYTRIAGVPFHDDVIRLRHFAAGRQVEIRPEPGNEVDHDALAVLGGGHRVGYIPASIAGRLAPAGTRVGHGIVMMEWSTNGVRHDIWVLGSMQVHLEVSEDE